jgi:hypothetical protein
LEKKRFFFLLLFFSHFEVAEPIYMSSQLRMKY